jgi:hypothetical protein
MKKKLILIAGMAIALAACTKNEMRDDSAQTEPVSWPSVITVATEPVVDSDTKSVIASDGAFSWFSGTGETAEKLGIYTSAGFKVYTCTDASTGTFGGDLEGETPSTVAVYPAGIYALSTKTLTVSMPSSYDYVATLAKTPMIAQIAGSIDNLAFKHIAALLKVSVANVPPTATQLVLETAENIAGDFVISDCTVADAAITNAGGSGKSVTVNFAATGTFTDKDFFIPIPTGTYDHFNLFLKDENGNKLAGRQFSGKTIARKDLASGDAISLPQLQLSDAIVLNDTQIGLRWSENAFATTSAAITADKTPAYTFGIYSDAACTSKLWDWETAANAAVFTSTPGHVFSGLTPATTYYVKVKDATNGIAAVKAFTTETAESNFVATATPAVNDVILNQNFNELLWGGEPVNKLSGVTVNAYNKDFTLPTDKTNNKICDPSVNLNLFKHAGSGDYAQATTYIAGTSLADWKGFISYAPSGQPNPICGGVRFGGNSSSGYLVSPQITGLDAPARVRVKFHASAYAAAQTFCVASFPASVEAYSASTTFYIKTAPLMESAPIAIAQDAWAEYSAEIDLPAGGRIGIGCPHGGSFMKVYVDDVKVEYLGGATPIAQKLVFANNTQIAVRWSTTVFQTPATDKEKTYSFGIYNDAACTDAVYDPFTSISGKYDNLGPGYVFSGLTPGASYYVKVVCGDDESVNMYSTTNLYPEAIPVRSEIALKEGDVLVYEDFGDLKFASNFIYKLAGYWPVGSSYVTGPYNDPQTGKGSITSGASNSAMNTLAGIWPAASGSEGANYLAGMRSFKSWIYTGTAPRQGNGYLFYYSGNSATPTVSGMIISPKINCLSKAANVKVSVAAAGYTSYKNMRVAVFGDEVSVSSYKTTDSPVSTTDIVLSNVVNATSTSIAVYSTVVHIEPGQRIGVGVDAGCLYIDDIKVELVSYD